MTCVDMHFVHRLFKWYNYIQFQRPFRIDCWPCQTAGERDISLCRPVPVVE